MDTFIKLAEESFNDLGIKGDTYKSGKFTTVQNYSISDSSNANRLCGNYYTINFNQSSFGNKKLNAELSCFLADIIANLLPSHISPLIVGLGNAFITSDSLGTQTINYLIEKNYNNYMLFKPSVYGLTKIESADAIKGVAHYVNPDCIIAIDALCCLNQDRLYSTIQITDSGIIPGGGLGNSRPPLTKETLGIPVISIGIPLISFGEKSLNPNSCVTPKEIDVIVKVCAKIICDGILKALS